MTDKIRGRPLSAARQAILLDFQSSAEAGDEVAREVLAEWEREVGWADALADDDAAALEASAPDYFESFAPGAPMPLEMREAELSDARKAWAENRAKAGRKAELAYEFPPFAAVEAEMREAIREWDFRPGPRWTLPESMSGDPGCERTFGRKANDPRQGQAPTLWALRPDKSLTQQALVDAIAALPRSKTPLGGDTEIDLGRTRMPEPQVRGPSEGVPFGFCFLAADEPDDRVLGGKICGRNAAEPFEHRGRTIEPVSRDEFRIASPHRAWSYRLTWYRDGGGENCIAKAECRVWDAAQGCELTLSDHIDRQGDPRHATDPDEASAFSWFPISDSAVYGSAWLPLKSLGFWGQLEVALNWLELLERAYRIAGPAAAPAPEPSDRVQPPAARIPPASREPEPPAPDADTDPLLDTLEEVVASRRQARAALAEARAAALESERLQAEADAARRRAAQAEERAEPARRAIRERAGRLLEQLQGDEDFPGIE